MSSDHTVRVEARHSLGSPPPYTAMVCSRTSQAWQYGHSNTVLPHRSVIPVSGGSRERMPAAYSRVRARKVPDSLVVTTTWSSSPVADTTSSSRNDTSYSAS